MKSNRITSQHKFVFFSLLPLLSLPMHFHNCRFVCFRALGLRYINDIINDDDDDESSAYVFVYLYVG